MPLFLTSIHKRTLLLVEGEEDRKFFEALIRHMQLTEIQILGLGGKTQLRTNLATLALTPGYGDVSSIGIVRDGDENPKAAFQSACNTLRRLKFAVPKRPMTTVGATPRVTVLVTPDGESPGMLEDICLAAVTEDVATACVDDYFDCLLDKGINLRDNVLSKARIHAFLASREQPDLRLGDAAQTGYFDWEHPAFDRMKEFLHQISQI